MCLLLNLIIFIGDFEFLPVNTVLFIYMIFDSYGMKPGKSS